MHVATNLHRVTIRCPERCGDLFHELRKQSQGHIVGDLRLELRTGRDTIHLTTDDLDAIREVLRRHAPEGTYMHVVED